MKLATLRDGSRDGTLIVVQRNLAAYTPAHAIAPTLQNALDRWEETSGALADLADALEAGRAEAHPLRPSALAAPLPRAYEWVDGSAYINHIVLVRKARGAEPPPSLETDPLVYQGGSGVLLGPCDDIPLVDDSWGLDFESEICAILGDTPQGTTAARAADHIRLLTLANDVSLRNLIPAELAKNFGFFISKPATAFGPVAITPDELGDAWQDGRVHLPLRSYYNSARIGDPDAGPAMHFSFFDLIQHITRTRGFTAGTILGSGTVSNANRSRGVSCLAERRMLEIIDGGKATTPFMKAGDSIEIEMTDASGASLFGRISQRVVKA